MTYFKHIRPRDLVDGKQTQIRDAVLSTQWAKLESKKPPRETQSIRVMEYSWDDLRRFQEVYTIREVLTFRNSQGWKLGKDYGLKVNAHKPREWWVNPDNKLLEGHFNAFCEHANRGDFGSLTDIDSQTKRDLLSKLGYWQLRIKINQIRLDKLHHISVDDVLACGVHYSRYMQDEEILANFVTLWDGFHPSGPFWAENPLVWVFDIELVKG